MLPLRNLTATVIIAITAAILGLIAIIAVILGT
jgi:hypothetical protein